MRTSWNNGKWTEGRFHSFVTSTLRSGSRRWPPKYETLNEAKTEKKKNPSSGRIAQFYRCNACKEEYVAKDVQVDHKKPVVDPERGHTTWDDYIERLFCEKKNLQVLCKGCHQVKTAKEKKTKSERK